MANKSAQSSKKPRGKSFEPGKSGNPGGRPKLPEDIRHVRELAREYTAQAVGALVEVLDSDSGSARVAAANALLDRGWGKPEQTTTMAGTLRVVAATDLTDDELAAIATSGGG